jgi:hypothetical protein
LKKPGNPNVQHLKTVSKNLSGFECVLLILKKPGNPNVQNLDTVPKNLSGFESLNSNIKLTNDGKFLSKIKKIKKKEQGNESRWRLKSLEPAENYEQRKSSYLGT